MSALEIIEHAEAGKSDLPPKFAASLQKINPARIYADLFLNFAVFVGLAFAILFTPSASFAVHAALWTLLGSSIYRGVSFLHEISHLQSRMPKVSLVYNVCFGFLFNLPAYTFYPHKYHHHRNTYGTIKDPGYKTLSRSPKWMVFRPFLTAFIYPFFLFTRFLFLPLFMEFTSAEFRLKIYKHLSTFVVNPGYERTLNSPQDLKVMRVQDGICSALNLSFLMAVFFKLIDFHFWLNFQITIVAVVLVNSYRAMIEHRYRLNDKLPAHEFFAQVTDSVTVPRTLFSFLWAPLNLNYHSLHHYLPGVPYYNLHLAHRELQKALPADHPYWKTVEPSFFSALYQFWKSNP